MVTVQGDGSIGPFPNPDGAAKWLTERLEMLCRLTGQNGTPDAWIVPIDTSGHECVCPAVYDSSTDTIRIHYTPTEDDIFDVAAVDGMLLHALGHRHRRARTRGFVMSTDRSTESRGAPVVDSGDSNPLSRVVEDRLGTHIRRISRRIIDAKAEALRPLDLTVPQYSTLLSVQHLGPTSAAQLARTGMGTLQATATMLSTLEGKGLVNRRPSPMHQKLVEVRLTPLGAKTIEEADRLAADIEARLRAAIGEDLFDSVLCIEKIAEDLLE